MKPPNVVSFHPKGDISTHYTPNAETPLRTATPLPPFLLPLAGNIGRVDFITENEYDLFVRPDTCNPRVRRANNNFHLAK